MGSAPNLALRHGPAFWLLTSAISPLASHFVPCPLSSLLAPLSSLSICIIRLFWGKRAGYSHKSPKGVPPGGIPPVNWFPDSFPDRFADSFLDSFPDSILDSHPDTFLEWFVDCYPDTFLEWFVDCYADTFLEWFLDYYPDTFLEWFVDCYPDSLLEWFLDYYPDTFLEWFVDCYPDSFLEWFLKTFVKTLVHSSAQRFGANQSYRQPHPRQAHLTSRPDDT